MGENQKKSGKKVIGRNEEMREISRQERIAGGLYGLLIGDALGVPYEFYKAEELPPYEQIEMVPPSGFRKTYSKVAAGTWSDDGAQALCLMDCLIKQERFSLKDYSDSLLAWYEEGFWAVDGVVFDVGIQTSKALITYKRGGAPEECGLVNPEGKGNGALMRVLPLALWHSVRGAADPERRNRELVRDAHSQCLITHGHICNQVCCALYTLAARGLLQEMPPEAAILYAVQTLRKLYQDMPEYAEELEWSIRPDLPWEGYGSGYVVDCLRSAFMIIEQAESYEETVKWAIQLGDDTDTTACVAGGLAGIVFGIQGIPERWLAMLRQRDAVDALLAQL